jgi:hypothetical protein
MRLSRKKEEPKRGEEEERCQGEKEKKTASIGSGRKQKADREENLTWEKKSRKRKEEQKRGEEEEQCRGKGRRRP